MACKGLCDRFKVRKNGYTNSFYDENTTFCSTCETYIPKNGAFCYCCNYRIRSTPRHYSSKLQKERRKAELKGIKVETYPESASSALSTWIAQILSSLASSTQSAGRNTERGG